MYSFSRAGKSPGWRSVVGQHSGPSVPAFNSCTKCTGSPGIIHNHMLYCLPFSWPWVYGWPQNWTTKLCFASSVCQWCTWLVLDMLSTRTLQPGTDRRPVDWCRNCSTGRVRPADRPTGIVAAKYDVTIQIPAYHAPPRRTTINHSNPGTPGSYFKQYLAEAPCFPAKSPAPPSQGFNWLVHYMFLKCRTAKYLHNNHLYCYSKL